jgi:hypothetical protein
MKQEILFIDVDRTIFDTDRFVVVLWEAIGKTYGIDSQAELNKLQSYYVYLSSEEKSQARAGLKPLSHYDFRSHVESVVKGHLADDVVANIQAILAKHNFVYPDTRAILQLVNKNPSLVLKFLTLEQEWYQLVKRKQIINSLPQLNNFAWHVVQEPKGEYIARVFPGTKGWLVDDKAQQLPKGYKLLWLQRKEARPILLTDGKITINSLNVVEEALKL